MINSDKHSVGSSSASKLSGMDSAGALGGHLRTSYRCYNVKDRRIQLYMCKRIPYVYLPNPDDEEQDDNIGVVYDEFVSVVVAVSLRGGVSKIEIEPSGSNRNGNSK